METWECQTCGSPRRQPSHLPTTWLSASGTSAPTGAKMMAASSGAGGASVDAPAHTAPKLARQHLRRLIASGGEREHLALVIHRHLRNEMGRRAKSIQSEPSRIADHSIRAVSNQSRAHQRRGFLIVITSRQLECISRVGGGVFRIAAIAMVTGETGVDAEILVAAAAHCALAAGVAEPWDADAIAHREPGHLVADRLHSADDFVSRHHRKKNGGNSPSTRCRSVRQTPHARTLTSSSPARAIGSA